MGKLILYGVEASPPVRAALLTLKALGVPYEYIDVNVLGGEHLTKEYLAKNPQHTVPTLEDDGNFIVDSHAAVTYLVSKYGKDDSLYPKDLLKRAVVDQRLHYECGVIYISLRNISAPLLFKGETAIPKTKIDAITAAYDMVETFLVSHHYVAGEKLTVADFSFISTISSLTVLAAIDAKKYPKISAWMKRLEALPYYAEANGKGAASYHELLKSKNFTIVA